MNVLISAFACEPGKGSDAGVGWNWALQAAKSHEVWVLTNETNREAIEHHLAAHPVPNLHFIYLDVPKWLYFLPREGPLHKLYYITWQVLVLPVAWRLHRRENLHLAHHLTYNAIDAPGFLWILPIPFLWGPVGGGQVPPGAFRRYFGHRWPFEVLRMLKKQSLRLDPVVRLAIRKATHTVAANAETERRLRRLHARSVSRMLEAGVTMPESTDRVADRDPVTIVWAGLFVHRKAPLLAIEAFHRWHSAGGQGRMIMIGDGPLRCDIQDEVAARKIDSSVQFRGRVPHGAMSDIYAAGDLFLFTSLQDTSGNVVLEAMSHGLPVIALDHQGAAEMVSAETGILVPVTDAARAITAIADGIDELATDAGKRMAMGAAARERARLLFSWESRAHQISKLYDSAVAARP